MNVAEGGVRINGAHRLDLRARELSIMQLIVIKVHAVHFSAQVVSRRLVFLEVRRRCLRLAARYLKFELSWGDRKANVTFITIDMLIGRHEKQRYHLFSAPKGDCLDRHVRQLKGRWRSDVYIAKHCRSSIN